VRSRDLLGSAIPALQATLMGAPLIVEPVECAAAFLFHLCGNDPLVDGNKRAALATWLVVLSLNKLLPTEVPDVEAMKQAGNGCLRLPRPCQGLETGWNTPLAQVP